jgi:hypothetical protein
MFESVVTVPAEAPTKQFENLVNWCSSGANLSDANRASNADSISSLAVSKKERPFAPD